MSRRRTLELAALAAVLGLALSMRWFANNSGIPGIVFPRNDEAHYVDRATAFLNGRWRVDYFINPSLFTYCLWGAVCVIGWVRVALGEFASFGEFALEATLNPYTVTMTGRVLSILSGVAGVGVLYAIGRRMFSARVGLVAALALALDLAHAFRSVIAINEAPMVLLVLLFFLALLRYLEEPSGPRHALCGLLLGLAVSTKYNAGVHSITLGVATLLVVWPDGPRGLARPRAWVGFPCAALGFVLGTPWAVLDPATFLRDFQQQASYLDEGFKDNLVAHVEPGWSYYVTKFPQQNVGLVFALACAAGLAFAVLRTARQRDSRALLLLSATVPLYLVLGTGRFHIMRFFLPAIPFVLLMGAWVAGEGLAWIGLGRAPLARSIAATALVALVFVPHALYARALTASVFGEPDHRSVLWEWMRANLDPGIEYLDVVNPVDLRFFDTRRAIGRYGVRSRIRTAAQRQRLVAFERASFRSVSLGQLMAVSPSLAKLRATMRERGLEQLIVLLPTGRVESEAFRDRLRRLLGKLPREVHTPAIRDCPYWDELVEFIVGLELVQDADDPAATLCTLRLPG